MIFKRKIYNELLQWKRTDEGRTALLIQGARRVGKSTIAEEFATNEYETHILVDFAACSTEIRDLFNDVSDLNRIFMRLQLEYAVELKERKSVIIFDEVQLAPKARQAIKYLVKDGRYDYIEGLTKKSPPKKKFSLSADMRELLCIFRLPNQCKYT